jgi:hypothetical protein
MYRLPLIRRRAVVSVRVAPSPKRFVPNPAQNFVSFGQVILWRVFLRKGFYEKFFEKEVVARANNDSSVFPNVYDSNQTLSKL